METEEKYANSALKFPPGGIKPATPLPLRQSRIDGGPTQGASETLNSDMRAQDFEMDRCIHHGALDPHLVRGTKLTASAWAARTPMFIRPQRG